MATLAKRGGIARNKLTSGLLVGAVASGMVAASLSTTAPANAWCAKISGLPSFGSSPANCSSTLFSFSLALDDVSKATSSGILTGAIALGGGTATSAGILTAAWAGGEGSTSSTDGTANWSVAQGTRVSAQAGSVAGDFLNLAFNFGTAPVDPAEGKSSVQASFGAFNIAANLGGNAGTQDGLPFNIDVRAGGSSTGTGTPGDPIVTAVAGWGNAALNLLGNRNSVWAFGGLLNAAIAVGNPFGGFPNGSNSIVHVGDYLENDPATLSVGFNVQPPLITEACEGICGNTVTVRNGLLSIAGSVGLVNKPVEQNYIGITLGTPLNATTATAALAAPTQQSLAAVSPDSDPGGSTATATAPKASKLEANSAGAKASSPNSVSDRSAKSTNKLSNAVSKIKAKRAEKS